MGEDMNRSGGSEQSSIWRWVVCACLLALTPIALTGCSVPAATRSAGALPASASSLATGATGGEWQVQAQRLATGLRDVEDSIVSTPEAQPGAKAQGTFEARIVSVSATGGLVVDRQTYFTGEAAVQAAKTAGSSISNDQFVTNTYREQLRLPVAPTAAFVVWYPGEDATNVSPDGMAAMSALSFDEFARLFATDSGKRQALQTWGGWVTVSDAGVTSFVEPNSP
jgi:hypothetical protein